tara:strand:+ start:287 stop:649 length:363 start_codon:yes stop_codon:yes gene_type:complete
VFLLRIYLHTLKIQNIISDKNIKTLDTNHKLYDYFEKEDVKEKMIRERQMEGIRIRKEKGLYKGRQIGTTDSIEKFLNKPKSKDILRDLDNGYGIREISEMRDCSFSTIYKTKRLSEELV